MTALSTQAYFEQLGQEIERAWAACRYDDVAFTDIAFDALSAVAPPPGLTPEELLAEAILADDLPRQHDPASVFGEPPVTVYRRGRFFISVLSWFDGTTSIHDHGFPGAFRVLHGSSVHTSHTYDVAHEASRQLSVGTLTGTHSEILRPGDVRPIRIGRDGIHSLFHLDRPSVTVVVRTERMVEPTPEYLYLRPGMAVDAWHSLADDMSRAHALQAMQRMDQGRALQLGLDLVRKSDEWVGFLVIHHWFLRRRGASLDRLIDTYERAHPDLGSVIREAMAHRSRERVVNERRRRIHDARARTFLALLMTLPHDAAAETILCALSAKARASDPWPTALKTVLEDLWDDGLGDSLELPLDAAIGAATRQADGTLRGALEGISSAIPPTPAEALLLSR